MSIVDYDKIISGTPVKRITNAYNVMKENYSEISAKDFHDVYAKEPLDAVIESSRSIFSEPRFGAEFISNITTPHISAFESSMELMENISEFYNENKDRMSETQKNVYESTISKIKNNLTTVRNTEIYSSYIKENIDEDFEQKLSSILYESTYNKDENKDYNKEVSEMFEDVHPIVYFTFSPYVVESLYQAGHGIPDFILNSNDYFNDIWNDENKKFLFESVVCCNKLRHDKSYLEAISFIPKSDRVVFEFLMETSINDVINTLSPVEKVRPEDFIHPTSESAVNNLFDFMLEKPINDIYDSKEKSKHDIIKKVAYESVLEILHTEYEITESTNDIAYGYSILTGNPTIEEAFDYVNSIYDSIEIPVTEAGEEIDVDKEINTMDQSISNGESAGKKPQAPNTQNKYVAKTNRYMDKEAKRLAKQQKKEQKGLERKMRFKAVTSAPRNTVQRIEQQINKFDEMDDERRKKYFSKPGFRKKWFRNLKLAILYGGAMSYKLALGPVVAMCRHFSKKKDRRMRNEMVRGLDTEIKICDEKINDANAESNKQEKYRLMRIKAQLEAERTRVATNSKYI